MRQIHIVKVIRRSFVLLAGPWIVGAVLSGSMPSLADEPKERASFKAHNDTIHSLAFSSDSKLLASGDGDKVVKLWNAATGNEEAVLTLPDRTVWSVAFSPQGD